MSDGVGIIDIWYVHVLVNVRHISETYIKRRRKVKQPLSVNIA
jgi:hypothetical protein